MRETSREREKERTRERKSRKKVRTEKATLIFLPRQRELYNEREFMKERYRRRRESGGKNRDRDWQSELREKK